MTLLAMHSLEPLTAFISRLAASRGVSMWDYRIHVDIRARYGRRAKVYDRLLQLTGLAKDVLQRQDVVNRAGNTEIFGMTFDLKDVWAKSTRICPCCVAQDLEEGSGRLEARPYLRFPWMLRSLGRCPRHGIQLVVVGPDYDRFSFGDFNGVLFRHWKDFKHLAEVSECAVSDSDVYFHGRIAAAADGASATKDVFIPELPGRQSMLDEMSLPAALLVTEIVGGMELYGDSYSRLRACDLERQDAVRRGFDITSCGYDGLRQFLTDRDKTHWSNSRHGHIRKLYGKLQELLASRIDDDGYRSVIAFVAEHAIRTHPLGPRDAFLGSALPRQLHTIRTAEIEHRIHRMTLRSILASADLLPAGADGRSDGRVVVDAAVMDALIADWRDRLPAEELKAQFGISGAALDEFTRHGLIDTKQPDPRRRSSHSAASYRKLLGDLQKLPRGSRGTGMRSLPDATRLANRSYAEIIDFILTGAVSNVIIDAAPGETFGFENIFLDVLELKVAARTDAPPGITFGNAERMLGTTTTTLKRIVDIGLLPSFEAINPATRCRQRYIRESALEEFRARYVSLYEYAKGRGQIAKVKSGLIAMGMVPVFEEPKAATFYRRSDLPI